MTTMTTMSPWRPNTRRKRNFLSYKITLDKLISFLYTLVIQTYKLKGAKYW